MAGILFWLLSPTRAHAQSEVDAVRLGAISSGVGARAMSMGSAFTAVSDDYSALFFNPAGLGQIKRSELQVGFDFNSYTSDAAYLGAAKSGDNTVTALNSVGLVLPVPTYQGSFVVAFGYNRLNNFAAAQNVSAFNPAGSISDYFLGFTPQLNNDGDLLLTDPGSLAFDTYLQDLNQAGDAYINSQIDRGNVRQLSELMEEGGMDAFSAAASIEIAPQVFAGLTLNFYSCNYTYSRIYRELDENNEYPVFSQLSLQDDITTDISGWGLKLGVLYRMDENFRFGLTVEIPKFLKLKDTYATTLQAFYDQPPAGATKTSYQSSLDGSFEYDLRTPFLFSFGFSYENELLILSAEGGFTDWTQLKFDADANQLDDVNRTIKSELTQALKGAVGVELHVPGTGLKLRGGYAVEQSPFKYKLKNPTQKTNFDDAKKSLTVGIGIILRNTVSIDAAYTLTSVTVENRLYGGSDIVKEDLSISNILLTASFRL
ncbi:MAG: hypothetical protein HGB19_06340 [Chlorobiales bacterium]|nr:hypothetical protein [Chlorobiales bacterium]